MTVSQILVENVNVISIEISFLEEQDLSISLVRHQKISCYVDATLQDATYDARTIIHVGVSDILNNQSHDQTAQLISNLREIIAKCKSYGVKHVFVSGLLHTSKIKENLLVDINRMIKELCMSDGSEYIDNDNIPRDMLYKDGLYLLDKEKYFLSQRFAWKLWYNFSSFKHIR